MSRIPLAALVAVSVSAPSLAFEPAPDASSLVKGYTAKSYSPYAARSFADRPLWGDTHLRTSTSFDAGAFGNRPDARAAYRLAQAEAVTFTTGFAVRLSRPLERLVVADHADTMGPFDLNYGVDRSINSDPDGDVLVLARNGNLAESIVFYFEAKHRRLLR